MQERACEKGLGIKEGKYLNKRIGNYHQEMVCVNSLGIKAGKGYLLFSYASQSCRVTTLAEGATGLMIQCPL